MAKSIVSCEFLISASVVATRSGGSDNVTLRFLAIWIVVSRA